MGTTATSDAHKPDAQARTIHDFLDAYKPDAQAKDVQFRTSFS
jgi:hypothetical protein